MSETKAVFYNLFWQNKACRNLFLLSKEEFLDTKNITIDKNAVSISFPRIILSNIQSKDEFLHDKIKVRTETHNIKTESLINSAFETYAPIIAAFLETKFSKRVEVLMKDFGEDPIAFILPILGSLFTSKEEFEATLMALLHKYKFVGKNIKTFKSFETFFEKEAVSKNFKTIISEQHLWTFLEVVKSVKDMYINESYKSLYNSNQILVSSFHDIDNFEDRLKLFSTLYDSEIIKSSKEDSFIECTSCPPLTYRGVFQLKTDPLKLRSFKCPVCDSPLTFYVPYELHKDIFEIIKSKDGMLLNAVNHQLTRNEIAHTLNPKYLNDIELDCVYTIGNKTYVVETKMYKQNTSIRKLKNKLKEHYSKLLVDIDRVQKSANQPIDNVVPILLVNINDYSLLQKTHDELKKLNKETLCQNGQIITINDLPIK